MANALISQRLFPYQQSWLRDPAQFKIGLWARQTGKDYTCAAEAVLDCYERKTHWLIVAAGERQALESLEKARAWADTIRFAMARALGRNSRPRPIVSNASEIHFPNGSRITALPAKPQTVRGYSANVILTEFAFHDDPEAIWRAVFPSVSNPLRGGLKKLRIITTPNGQGNFFHQLWLNAPRFSKHRVTIQDAHGQGLPVDLQMLRQGLFNPDAWAQEYECEFLDGSCVLLPYELIDACESTEATESSTPEYLSTLRDDLFAGIDFGRKHDLTVCWLLQRVAGTQPGAPFTFVTREVLVLDKMSTPAQLELLRPRVARARRVCLDYTGAGVGLGDLLAAEFGSSAGGGSRYTYTHRLASSSSSALSKIDLCQFTSALKQELFPTLRAAFERRLIAIPHSQAIREDLHGVHKFVTGHGSVTYRATHTADGHSDRCTALALALRAASEPAPNCGATSIEVPRFRSTV